MPKLIRISCFGLALLLASTAWAKSPFSLVKFKRSKSIAKSSKLLTEDDGPWMIFVGAALAIKEGTHIRVSLFVDRLPARVNRFLTMGHLALVAIFLAIKVWTQGRHP